MTENEIKTFWSKLARNAKYMIKSELRQPSKKAEEVLKMLETNLSCFPDRPLDSWLRFSKSKFAADCMNLLMPTPKHRAFDKLKATYTKIINL